MNTPAHPSRLVPATRSEQLRIRADQRDRKGVVRIDLWEPLTRSSQHMTAAGRPLFVPVEGVDALIAALQAAKAEAERDQPAAEPEPQAVDEW